MSTLAPWSDGSTPQGANAASRWDRYGPSSEVRGRRRIPNGGANNRQEGRSLIRLRVRIFVVGRGNWLVFGESPRINFPIIFYLSDSFKLAISVVATLRQLATLTIHRQVTKTAQLCPSFPDTPTANNVNKPSNAAMVAAMGQPSASSPPPTPANPLSQAGCKRRSNSRTYPGCGRGIIQVSTFLHTWVRP